MLAVLPFQNLTGDAGQDYFSDGLTEEMITQLGNLDPQHLRVIARTSVMRYKNSETPLDRVARELGVQYVIEGSVRRDADNVRIAAQLIQARDQTHVWARQYDRRVTGLLTLQGEIAREIADEIQLTLEGHSHAASPRPAVAPREYEAYDLYLRGQYFFNERTAGSLRKAIEYFQQATANDPNYARAYTGLADSYALMGGYTSLPPTEFMPKARAAALRALEIDDRLAEAHTALALIVQNYDWDWQTAEREFRRAIELNPNYATAHQWYAEHLMWLGRFDEALRESERARELDPLSLIIAADKGAVLFFSRDYDRAIEEWRSVLEMDPGFRRAHLIRAAYLEKGMFTEALADVESTRSATPVAGYYSWRAHIFGRAGRTEEARHSLRELVQFNRSHPADAMIVAWAYLGLGDRDEALGWLEEAYAEHSTELTSLRVHPGFDPIRGDPRFQDLLRRVGLAK
jgi:TolB-like protein